MSKPRAYVSYNKASHIKRQRQRQTKKKTPTCHIILILSSLASAGSPRIYLRYCRLENPFVIIGAFCRFECVLWVERIEKPSTYLLSPPPSHLKTLSRSHDERPTTYRFLGIALESWTYEIGFCSPSPFCARKEEVRM